MAEKLDKAKGRTKKATGEATGNKKLKNEGRVDKASAKAKRGVGRTANKAKKGIRRAQ
jgi:uncharacterized protein YjbJ (UPF0337 family)